MNSIEPPSERLPQRLAVSRREQIETAVVGVIAIGFWITVIVLLVIDFSR